MTPDAPPPVPQATAARSTPKSGGGWPLLRNMALPALFEVFLVSAVVSLLLIRAGLALSGFPRVGGGGLHIAHMLWGGLLMVASVLLLLGYLGRAVQFAAAAVSGIGFGTFIDEIGKFVTSDNNYFFRPAVALIYVAFVLLSLSARALEGRRRFTDRELLANAFDLAREARLHNRRPAHNARVLAYLERDTSGDLLISGLRQTLQAAASEPPLLPGPFRWLRRRLALWYVRLTGSPRLEQALLVPVGIYALFVVASMVVLVAGWRPASGDNPGVARTGVLAADLLTLAMVAGGSVTLRRSRLSAYRWFERAVMVNLLVAQVFTFYLQQFGALGGLAIDLVLVVLLNGMIRTERREMARGGGPPRPSGSPRN